MAAKLGRHDLPDAAGGADGDGGLVNRDFGASHVPPDLLRHFQHKAQARGAIAISRRAHGDEDEVPMFNGLTRAGAELNALGNLWLNSMDWLSHGG